MPHGYGPAKYAKLLYEMGKIDVVDNGGGGATRYSAYCDLGGGAQVGYGATKKAAKFDLESKILMRFAGRREGFTL